LILISVKDSADVTLSAVMESRRRLPLVLLLLAREYLAEADDEVRERETPVPWRWAGLYGRMERGFGRVVEVGGSRTAGLILRWVNEEAVGGGNGAGLGVSLISGVSTSS